MRETYKDEWCEITSPDSDGDFELDLNCSSCGNTVSPYITKKGLEWMNKHRCRWTETDEAWETDCGKMYSIESGTPAENGMVYCTFCSRKIK